MRKFFSIIAGTFITGTLFAGGLVTNTNQSATWVRMPSRNASVEADAVYYNPAGLMQLENGFHFSLSNQTIWQTRTIENSYAGPDITGDNVGDFGLNEHTYTGKVFAPLFPSIYAVYKIDRFAFSLGFMPVGGGGGATYEKGLPSFELTVSDLVPALASQGFDSYSTDIKFEGSSIFLGYQGTVSYKIADWISVAAGARYVTAKNTYTGHLQNIQLGIAGTWLPATTVFDGIVSQLTSIIGIPTSLAGAIGAGFGGATLQNLVDAGMMSTEQKAGIEQGLVFVGVPPAALPTLNLLTISGTITAATPTLMETRGEASATRTLLADKTADVVQKGSGITPIFSVNLTLSEKLNIAVKFEMATKLELTNETAKDLLVGYTAEGDSITQFPDGEKTRNDMPAMLTVGLGYKISPKLKLALGGSMFFDKSANYGHKVDADFDSSTPPTSIGNKDIIEKNGFVINGALEYNLSDKLLVSGGYAYANKGVNSRYQSDLTFGNATHTMAGGGAFAITEKIKINLGASYTVYVKDEKSIVHPVSGSAMSIRANESYKKGTFVAGLGLDIAF